MDFFSGESKVLWGPGFFSILFLDGGLDGAVNMGHARFLWLSCCMLSW